jgi:hypothetical protein
MFASLQGLGEKKIDEKNKNAQRKKTGASDTTLGYLRQAQPIYRWLRHVRTL